MVDSNDAVFLDHKWDFQELNLSTGQTHRLATGGTGLVGGVALAADALGNVWFQLAARAGAPVGLGHEDAEQAEPGGLVNQVTREFASLIDGLGAWLDLPLGEIPDQPPDLLLFRAEREIHQFTRMMVASPCAIPEQIPAAPEPPPRRRSS